MKAIDIINKKRNKEELIDAEIEFFIDSYLLGDIPDYQMSALLMAICLNGMSDAEIFALTDVFIKSGDVLDLSVIDGIVVDKHSTGGVGDKTTLILAPLVASCGVKVAKMSGRGLGHTGGTIDKLESIPEFDVNLSEEQFINQVNAINVAIVSQTTNIVPADKKIYALRDVTATVESIPLIASSIMSKKIASGALKIVIDIKIGRGALIKNIEDARKLAALMIKIGRHYNREVVCLLTNMNYPLGSTIGNSLEVMESIEILQGKGSKDLEQLVIVLATIMVSLAKNMSFKDAREQVVSNLKSGLAYNKFLELVKEQHGNLKMLHASNKVTSLKSDKNGYINAIDALKLGELARDLGAGRLLKTDAVAYEVGFKLHCHVGDKVDFNSDLISIYKGEKAIDFSEVRKCFTIEEEKREVEPLIFEAIK